jgi:WD40 repeat protein
VWHAATGRAEAVLKGHRSGVTALAVSGDRLVSGSRDQTLRVWKMGGPPLTWPCEHALAGHGGDVLCVASFGGEAMSGSADKTIRVWVVGTGACERALAGHEGAVEALVAVRGHRLLSAARDRTVRLWSLRTGACERELVAYPPHSPQSVRCLAVVGSRLVGGSASQVYSAAERFEVCVWDAETLALEHAFPQPAGQMVTALAAEEGRLWACVGPEVVVWGHGDDGEGEASDTDASVMSGSFMA